MRRFEPVLDRERPAAVLVVGDVNSTLACALVAVKKGVPVIHVEAGLRSYDRAMPEEINRVLTDQISDLMFITEKSARDNLLREGIAGAAIHFVGNVMIDTLRQNLKQAVPAGADPGPSRRPGGPDTRRATPCSRCTGRPTWTTPRRCVRCSARCARSAAGFPWSSPCIRERAPRSSSTAWPQMLNGSARHRAAAGRLPGDAGADAVGAAGADRLGRHPGGDHGARRSVRHAAREHRAADHRGRGHEHDGRARTRRASSRRWTTYCAPAARPGASRSCGTARRRSGSPPCCGEWLDRGGARLVA